MSEAHAISIMEAHSSRDLPGPQFSEHHFLLYLFDTRCNFAIDGHIHHDMTFPLSHYFIFTGHNSYLTGNQLSSACSERPIAEALRRGVRVVELDLWPNSPEDDISVLHGRTLTSPVEFKKCLAAIKESAFVKSHYPVVITLEDHLGPDLQTKAAEAIVEIFGSALYYPNSAEELKQFPSPESLKGRILISTKPPKEYLEASSTGSPNHIGREEVAVEEAKTEKQSFWRPRSYESSSDEEDVEVSAEFHEGEFSDEANKHPERCDASPDYKRIITIRGGKTKGKSLMDALKVEENAKRISLSEPQLTKIAASHPSTIIQFTHNNFLRIYPKGLRINSSNYNPVQAWSYGAQMAAMNMQGYGKHLWVAQGFFRANGGCGYVKKPKFLFPENAGSKITTLEVKQKLKVKVCMGSGWREQLGERKFDKFSPPDFYTRIGIAGVKADSVMKKTAIMDDIWEPIWDEEFEFALRVPELAVLRIEVLESQKTRRAEFAGQICLPVSELKPGYRVVCLCDKKGDEWELVKLLLHFHLSASPLNTR